MWRQKDEEIARLKIEVSDQMTLKNHLTKLIRRHNLVVDVGYTFGLISPSSMFETYVDKLEREKAESLAMAELTGRVEKILIDKGLLPKPKEKK